MKLLGLFKVSRGESLDRIYLLKLFGYGIFLHRIHKSDPKGLYHNHPWNGLSFIFGTYIEVFRPRLECVGVGSHGVNQLARVERRMERSYFNRVDAKRHHRVEVSKPTWTLFIHGPKCNDWEIVNERGEQVSTTPWEGHEGTKSYTNAAKAA